jgi:hypothetical protein
MSHKERAAGIAAQREHQHRGNAKTRNLTDDTHLIGLCGELAFSDRFGVPMDTSLRPGGDGGIDFRLPIGSVDVKTSRRQLANTLRVEAGTVKAALYVLASYDSETGNAYLVGWEYGTVLRAIPPRKSTAGVTNHYRAASTLRTIDELYKLHTAALAPAPEIPEPKKSRGLQPHIRPECHASEGSAGWQVWVSMNPRDCQNVARVAENYGYATSSQFLVDIHAVHLWMAIDYERAAYKVCQGIADGEAAGYPTKAIKLRKEPKQEQARLV